MLVNKKNLPEIHIDIGSHNANPRKRTAVRKAAPRKSVKRVDPYLAATGIIKSTIFRAKKETSANGKQAAVSYAQGIIDFCRKINLITAKEHVHFISELKKAMG